MHNYQSSVLEQQKAIGVKRTGMVESPEQANNAETLGITVPFIIT